MANQLDLFQGQSVQITFPEAALLQKLSEHQREHGVAIIVLALQLSSALREPAFQVPQRGDVLDSGGSVLGFPDQVLFFSVEGLLECLASHDLLRRRPFPVAHDLVLQKKSSRNSRFEQSGIRQRAVILL